MLGPQCCENPPTLNSSSGNGSVLQLGGFNTYVSGPSTSKLVILFVSDIYGSLLTKLQLRDTMWLFLIFLMDKGFEDAKQIVAALKDKGISAIGAAGFCWGAKVVVDLAKSDNIQAAVLLHPSLVKVDDFKEVKPPIAILAAEIDKFCPPELIKQYEKILSSKPEVDKFVKIFPGVKHGWTVRYDVEDKEAVQHAEEAHRDLLGWFTKHVKYSQKRSGYSNAQGPRSSM